MRAALARSLLARLSEPPTRCRVASPARPQTVSLTLTPGRYGFPVFRQARPTFVGAAQITRRGRQSAACGGTGFPAVDLPFGVIIELDGKLRTPAPEATVTAEEFIAARSRIREIHESMRWNPWVFRNDRPRRQL